MKAILTALILALSFSTQAAEIVPAREQQAGINEKVILQYLGSRWGYTFERTGFYMGTGTVSVVPVTREAARVLNSLKKTSRYNCLIQNSTFMGDVRGEELLGGTYFVLDLNCD